MKHKFKLIKQENEKIAEVSKRQKLIDMMILIVCCVLYESLKLCDYTPLQHF